MCQSTQLVPAYTAGGSGLGKSYLKRANFIFLRLRPSGIIRDPVALPGTIQMFGVNALSEHEMVRA
ncbi:MAG: hypothetical protein ACYC3X_26995 [Pirellulaceae bacterium]